MADPVACAAPFIGIPFAEHGRDRSGCDCWGLVRLVLADWHGIALPPYTAGYADTMDIAAIDAMISGAAARPPWREIAGGDIGAIVPGQVRRGDGVLIRMRGRPVHVGVVVAYPHFLHIEDGIDSQMARVNEARWRHRVLGFYRHEQLDDP